MPRGFGENRSSAATGSLIEQGWTKWPHSAMRFGTPNDNSRMSGSAKAGFTAER